MMNILFKVTYHRKEEARRRAAEDFVKRFQKSARYWDKTDLEKVWFRVGEEAERHTFVEAYGDDLRLRNEDLDPYVRFEELVLVDTAFYVYVKVGIDAEDAVDFGISLRLNVGTSRMYRNTRQGSKPSTTTWPGRSSRWMPGNNSTTTR